MKCPRCALPILLIFALLGATRAEAQLVTDRPDFVEASVVVGAGVVQFETSVAWTDAGPGVDVWTTPSLVRVGIGPRWELRAESALFTRASASSGEVETGIADVALGAKVHLSDGARGRPSTALLLHVELPSGSSAYRGRGARPSLRATAEWELPAGMGLGIMPGLALGHDGAERFVSGVLGAVVGWGWSEDLRSFAEVAFSQIAADQHGGVVATFDTGVTLLLGADRQLDFGVALPLTDGADDLALALGFSLRVGA